MLEGRVGICGLEGVQAPVLEIAQPRRDTLSSQCKQTEDMIAGAAGIDVMLVDFDPALVSVEPVQHIDGFILGGAHRQDVEMAVLVGNPGVELAPGIAAVMNVDVAAPGAPAGGSEELAVRGGGRAVAPELGVRMRQMGIDDYGQGRFVGLGPDVEQPGPDDLSLADSGGTPRPRVLFWASC